MRFGVRGLLFLVILRFSGVDCSPDRDIQARGFAPMEGHFDVLQNDRGLRRGTDASIMISTPPRHAPGTVTMQARASAHWYQDAAGCAREKVRLHSWQLTGHAVRCTAGVTGHASTRAQSCPDVTSRDASCASQADLARPHVRLANARFRAASVSWDR